MKITSFRFVQYVDKGGPAREGTQVNTVTAPTMPMNFDGGFAFIVEGVLEEGDQMDLQVRVLLAPEKWEGFIVMPKGIPLPPDFGFVAIAAIFDEFEKYGVYEAALLNGGKELASIPVEMKRP